jgi:hypothetical protein
MNPITKAALNPDLLAQVWLQLASEHRSVRVALAALRLASTAGVQVRGSARPAGRAVVEDELLPAAQELVMLMVHHGDAGVRREACRALQSLVRCLTPGVICCLGPMPSAEPALASRIPAHARGVPIQMPITPH